MAGDKAEYEVLGEQFVQQYYQLFDNNQKEQLISLYHSTAMLTYEDTKTQGHDGIKDILMNKVRFQKIVHAVTKLDCQPIEGGVIVMVSGMLKADDDNPIPYCETFVIRPADGSFFIFQQIFRLSIHNM